MSILFSTNKSTKIEIVEVGPLPALGTNVPREAGVVRGEATCDAPVPVPGESVPDGSRVLSFRSTQVCVRVSVILVFNCLVLFNKHILHSLVGRKIHLHVSFIHVSFSFLS